MWEERYPGAGESWEARAPSGGGAVAPSAGCDIAVGRAQRKGRVAVEAARLLQRRCRYSEHWDMTCRSNKRMEPKRHGKKGHGAQAKSVSSSGEMFYMAYVYVNGIWELGALTPKTPESQIQRYRI